MSAPATAPAPARTRLMRAWQGSPLRHGVALGLFSLAAALVLSLGDTATEAAIAARRAEDLTRALASVIPPEMHDNDVSQAVYRLADDAEGEIAVYRATRDGAVGAVAFELTGYGYGGAIRVLIGLDAEGTVLGARVLAHTETPGLGDWIEARKSDWIDGFAGRALGNPDPRGWAVRKDGGDFDQFSGATITPRAVVATVLRGLHLFERHRETLLSQPGGPAG